MRVCGIQHDIVWEDPAANLAALGPRVEEAAAGGARLVVLTEMFSTGFSMAAERIAEAPDGPSATFLAEAAARSGAWVAGSIPTADPAIARPVNRLTLCGPDGERVVYDKIHPFSFAGEHEHYSAGTDHVTVEVEGVRVSLFVCYDLRFADEFWALAAATDLYVVVANWPAARHEHWSTLLRARAIENQAYVLGVNRVGEGDGLAYRGDSVLLDPLGTAVSSLTPGEEGVVAGEVDPAVVADVRARFPFLQDRRPPS